MLVVGLTGGIGSGKTTISKIFSALGVPVFNSDEVSKSILFSQKGSQPIIQEFGSQICEKGVINKAKLAKIVFDDKLKLSKLNAILHPLVAEEFVKWKTNQNFSYCIKEAAILFESGGNKACDFVITVSCSEEERVKRVLKRDNRSIEEINAIINKQWPELDRIKYADFSINNENQKVIPQALALHDKFIR